MSYNDAVCDLMAENGNLLAERDHLKQVNAQLVGAMEKLCNIAAKNAGKLTFEDIRDAKAALEAAKGE